MLRPRGGSCHGGLPEKRATPVFSLPLRLCVKVVFLLRTCLEHGRDSLSKKHSGVSFGSGNANTRETTCPSISADAFRTGQSGGRWLAADGAAA